MGQPRSTQRYRSRRRELDAALEKQLLRLVRRYPRYGYRRMTALLRREGWVVNRKRVYRLWRKLGLKVPQRQKRRRRRPAVPAGASRLRADGPGHVWSYDFAWDQTLDGRPLKILAVYDEGTRTCLALRAERRMAAWQVRETLEELMSQHGAPVHLRSDNGPEFVEKALCQWLDERQICTAFIPPGEPWENPFVESFFSRLRDELLNREIFTSLREAQILLEQYRQHYNQERPHSALGYVPPAIYCGGLF